MLTCHIFQQIEHILQVLIGHRLLDAHAGCIEGGPFDFILLIDGELIEEILQRGLVEIDALCDVSLHLIEIVESDCLAATLVKVHEGCLKPLELVWLVLHDDFGDLAEHLLLDEIEAGVLYELPNHSILVLTRTERLWDALQPAMLHQVGCRRTLSGIFDQALSNEVFYILITL